jgi:hypothetical protein
MWRIVTGICGKYGAHLNKKGNKQIIAGDYSGQQ